MLNFISIFISILNFVVFKMGFNWGLLSSMFESHFASRLTKLKSGNAYWNQERIFPKNESTFHARIHGSQVKFQASKNVLSRFPFPTSHITFHVNFSTEESSEEREMRKIQPWSEILVSHFTFSKCEPWIEREPGINFLEKCAPAHCESFLSSKEVQNGNFILQNHQLLWHSLIGTIFPGP